MGKNASRGDLAAVFMILNPAELLGYNPYHYHIWLPVIQAFICGIVSAIHARKQR